jgi:hypothetical protein
VTVQFDTIFSLGRDCEIGLQMQRFGWQMDGSVFEWLVTPWEGMMRIFADEGARLGQKIYPSDGGHGAACSHYDVLYWHEFPRNAFELVEFSVEAVQACRAKLRHKMQKMLARCETASAVLFIRQGVATTAPIDRFAKGDPFGQNELNGFVDMIAARFPRLKFSLLFMEIEGEVRAQITGPLDPRITHVILPAMRPQGDRGQMVAPNAEWDEVFSAIPYSQPRWDMARGEMTG